MMNFEFYKKFQICNLGEMTEWPIVQHWKCCVGETLPWVRIPLSPPSFGA